MKLLLVVCSVLSMVAADWSVPTREQVLEYRQGCIKDVNVSPEGIQKLKIGQYPDEPSIRCYVRCNMKKCGVWDDSTGLNSERAVKLLALLGDAVTMNDVDKCKSKNIENQDTCESAWTVFKCLLDSKIASPLKSS